MGSRADCPPTGTSKMNPWRCVSVTLEAPVKSGPTSGPLTVSSQLTQASQGMGPPQQFICGPLWLGEAGEGGDDLAERGDLGGGGAPAGGRVVGGGPVAEGADGAVDLVVADQGQVAALGLEAGHAVVAAGQRGAVVEEDGLLGVVERAVLEPGGQVQPYHAVAQVGDGPQRRLGCSRQRSGQQSGERASGRSRQE